MSRKPNRVLTLPTPEQVDAEYRRLKRKGLFRKELLKTVSVLIVVAALAVLLATLFLPVLQVVGNSMEPTLSDGDVIILIRTEDFETGDLIGLRYGARVLLKRVIGGPGDWIVIDDEGDVFVNGVLLDEPYITDKSKGETDLTYPYQVPEDSYFVMGDHRNVSIDSRNSEIGCISTEQVIGRVLFRIWPLSEISALS